MIVVDASIWVSCLVPQDVYHEASRRWLEQYTGRGGRLVAPVLLLAEAAGAIARRTGQATLAFQAVDYLLHFPALRIVPVDQRLGRETARLAADLSLRGADAVYVAVAHHLSIPLLTWDAEQHARAGKIIACMSPLSPADV